MTPDRSINGWHQLSVKGDPFNGGSGGGISHNCGPLTVSRSTISGNSTGNGGFGGGWGGYGGGMSVHHASITINSSTISNNRTGNGGKGGSGGGVSLLGYNPFELHNSTIVNNITGEGGGNFGGDGAGIYFWDNCSLSVRNSTIAGNSTGLGGTGGAIYCDRQSPYLTIENSIVAGNSATSAPDLLNGTARYSLIGNNSGSGLSEAPVGMPDANGNFVGGPTHGVIDPALGPLADNGGPTHTRLLLGGSPAIDAGDPAALAGIGNTPLFDQRGSPYIRVLGGRMDMGAVESRPAIAADGDFNDDGLYDCLDIDALVEEISLGGTQVQFDMTGDGSVDLADRDAWLAEAGSVNLGAGRSYLLGDATLDGVVDGSDFSRWNSHKFTAVSAWCSGDFNADGLADGSDFGIWNANRFTSSPRPVVYRAAVFDPGNAGSTKEGTVVSLPHSEAHDGR